MKKISKRVLVIPDMHFPYHDMTVWKLILKACATLGKGDEVVIIGDFADFYRVSSHSKAPGRLSFEEELDSVNGGLDDLEAVQKRRGFRVTYVEGNHEYRLERYLTEKAPDLFGLVKCRKLFRISERGWKYVGYRKGYKVGKMYFTHDMGRSGKNAAMQSLQDYGGNLCIGHTHRGAVVYAGTVRGDTHVCLNVGWGGDLSQIDYMHEKKALREWQHGFGIVDFDARGNCLAQFIPVINKSVCFDGKVIK